MHVSPQDDIQTTIDAIAASGVVSFIAHSYCHGHELVELLKVKGYTGIDIFWLLAGNKQGTCAGALG